ncbi:hypothetical protein HUJ05_007464 [Dendroctonus ponderosae]|nr:hypothetical protein HUJ05_007464 [Dendroctonus ponderosae]
MENSDMYGSQNKWCFVPGCKNTSISAPNKLFLTVPHDYARLLISASKCDISIQVVADVHEQHTQEQSQKHATMRKVLSNAERQKLFRAKKGPKHYYWSKNNKFQGQGVPCPWNSSEFRETPVTHGLVTLKKISETAVTAVPDIFCSLRILLSAESWVYEFENHQISRPTLIHTKPLHENKISPFAKTQANQKAQRQLGCDGVNSSVRKAMEADYLSWSYNQMGVVATVRFCEKFNNEIAWQRFLPNGPIALLPVSFLTRLCASSYVAFKH